MTKEKSELWGPFCYQKEGPTEKDLTSYPQPHHKSPMEPDPWLDKREKTPTHMDF
jgi:hypothetical protein